MIGEAAQSRAESHLARGYALALTGTFVWSATGPMIAYLLASTTLLPVTLAAWRDLLTAGVLALLLAAFARHRLRLPRRHWGFLAAYGAALALTNAVWTWSVQLNGAAISTVLVYTSPALVALGSRWLFGEKLSRVIGVSLVLSIVGVALVAGLYDPLTLAANPAGTILGIGSGALFAAYSLFGKGAARRGLHATTIMVYTFGVAGALLFLAAGRDAVPTIPPSAWLGLLILAAGPTLGGYGLFTASLAYLPAANASLITVLEPALTACLAWVFLGETMTPLQLLGGALIVSSVVALALGERRSE